MAKSLQERIPDILKYIQDNSGVIKINDKLFEIYEGDLLSHVAEALSRQLDRQPYKEAMERVPGINILVKVVNKLSTLYNEPPSRFMSNDSDQELLDFYIKDMNLDSYMQDSNSFYNLFKNSAIEPYLDSKGQPKVRVIPSNQFLVYSDDRINPTDPTVFIKFMGCDSKGVNTYWLYSDEEFLAITDTGSIVFDDMVDNPEGENPIGKIPFVYLNKSKHKLIPNPDTDLLSMTVLVPILLADLNFASKYQTFSIVYGIDVDIRNIEINPSALWSFKSDPQGKEPKVGTIKPEADIVEMLTSIQTQLGMWFETRDLNAATVGNLDSQNAASGIALMIQNIDATENKKVQATYFKEVEGMFWDLLINHFHPYWMTLNTLPIEANRRFIEDKVLVRFSEQRIIKTEEETLNNVIRKLEEGLITKRRAIRELNPGMDDREVEALLDEVGEDNRIFIEPSVKLVEEDESDSGTATEN